MPLAHTATRGLSGPGHDESQRLIDFEDYPTPRFMWRENEGMLGDTPTCPVKIWRNGPCLAK